jgi:hypothetical protein
LRLGAGRCCCGCMTEPNRTELKATDRRAGKWADGWMDRMDVWERNWMMGLGKTR